MQPPPLQKIRSSSHHTAHSGNSKSRQQLTCAGLIIILASDLMSRVVVSSSALEALVSSQQPKRSVRVSTSVISSARLEPPVGQIVARSISDHDQLNLANQRASWDEKQTLIDDKHNSNQQQQEQQNQQTTTTTTLLGGKIRDYSRTPPINVQQIRRRQVSSPSGSISENPTSPASASTVGWQLLKPRRASDPPVSTTTDRLNGDQTSRADERSSTSAPSPSGDATGQLQARQMQPAPGRSLKTVLRGAKNLLSGSFTSIEQRAGGSILWLGSNLLATLIPLASLLGLPSFATPAPGQADSTEENSSASSQTNQTRWNSSFGRRLIASLSHLANGQQLMSALATGGNNGLQGRVEYLMGWLERSVEHLPSFPRLHPQECVKRSICEAHHEPNKYGAVGLTLRMLFPASSTNGSDVEMDNMEYKVINKYRHAAGYGQSRRLDTNGGSAGQPVCKEKYDDCLVSLLEVGQKLLDFFLR